jgi:hypothetical protein
MQGQQRLDGAGAAMSAMKVLKGGRQMPNLAGLKKLLADYIGVLEQCMLETDSSERKHYQQHLAFAARIFAALEKKQSSKRLHGLLAAAHRVYSLALLESGEAAATAFESFVSAVERAVPAPVIREKKEKMNIKDEKKRYEVRFDLFPPHDGNMVTYQVFTTMGPTKAIVIATQSHLDRKGDPILRVASLKPMAGEEPGNRDLIDRLEF